MDSIVDLRMHMDRSPYTINEVHNPFKKHKNEFSQKREIQNRKINISLSTFI